MAGESPDVLAVPVDELRDDLPDRDLCVPRGRVEDGAERVTEPETSARGAATRAIASLASAISESCMRFAMRTRWSTRTTQSSPRRASTNSLPPTRALSTVAHCNIAYGSGSTSDADEQGEEPTTLQAGTCRR